MNQNQDQFPQENGLYKVTLLDGSKQDAWFIRRKMLWVTPDGADAISGVVAYGPAVPAVQPPPVQGYSSHYLAQIADIEAELKFKVPEFVELVKNRGITVLSFHQDHWLGLAEKDVALLGKAIKFAGHHGKEIFIRGRNQTSK